MNTTAVPPWLRPLWPLIAASLGAYLLALVLPVPLFDPDEGLHAAIAREMVDRADWVTPRLLGEPFLDKPILYFWALATSIAAFGASEFAVRLPGIAFGLAGALATASLGTALAGRRAGALSGIVHATMFLPFAVAAVSVHDIALVPFTTLTVFALWNAAWSDRWRAAVGWGVLAGGMLGAAMLTKALSGVAAIGLPFAVWMLWNRRTTPALIAAGVVSVVVGGAVAAPWFLAMDRSAPGYLHYFFVERHLHGFTTTTQTHGTRGWWYYLPILVGGALPWTAFLWLAARDLPRLAPASRAGSAQRLLWTWLLVGLMFFSAAGSKLSTYVLPLVPAIALLVGTAWDRRWTSKATDDAALALADRVGGVALGLLPPAMIGTSIWWFGLTPEPVFGTFVALGGLAIAWLWLRADPVPAPTRFRRLVTAFSLVGALAVLVVMAPAAPAFSARALARHFNAQHTVPRTIWFVDERVGSFLFYLDRDLCATLGPDGVDSVPMNRVLSLRQAPPGLSIVLSADVATRVGRRVALGGVPHVVAGRHRLYDGATLAAAVRRSAP